MSSSPPVDLIFFQEKWSEVVLFAILWLKFVQHRKPLLKQGFYVDHESLTGAKSFCFFAALAKFLAQTF